MGRTQLSHQHTDPDGGSPTLLAWVQVEGHNGVRLGAATAGIDRSRGMADSFGGPQPSWGIALGYRDVFRRGEWVEGGGREAGPDKFPVPCVLRVTIDSGAGTLSVAIAGGEDLGVVVDQLPTNEQLHLAVGTFHDDCRVTLLDGEPTGGFMRASVRACDRPCVHAQPHGTHT